MQQVLTLIADPARADLEHSTAVATRSALEDAGADTVEPDWLADGVACDIGFEGASCEDAEAAVRNRLDNLPVDLVAQPCEGRRKKLLVSDMESTVIENEMVDDLAELAGAGDKVSAITRRAMNGEIEFRPALRERVAALKGLHLSALEEAARNIRYIPGAFSLVQTMRANGAYTALVSGGFRLFSSYVRDRTGFDTDFANELLMDGDRLSGEVREPILGKDAKLEALKRMTAEFGYRVEDSVAVGDGANDLPMLLAAGLGVAFRAKPAVASATRVRIDHGDLTALLYLQGYRRDDFVD